MGKSSWSRTLRKISSHKALYIMIIPFIVFTFIFSYYPLRGWIMAFQNFKPATGMANSPFVGLAQFEFLLTGKFSVEFWRSVRNTLGMSVMILISGFIFPITFALLLNEVRSIGFKRVIQTCSYLPHFLSMIIVCALVSAMFSTGVDGAINNVLKFLGIVNDPVFFLGEEKYFWWIVTFTNVWKSTGWNSIIYIAAIAGIDPTLYEVASLDGANRYQKMWHVTLTGIRSTIIVLVIMNTGRILTSAGFEIQYILGGGLLQDVSQTIDIFVLKFGLKSNNYSLATAAGMLNSTIALILVYTSNMVATKFGDGGIV